MSLCVLVTGATDGIGLETVCQLVLKPNVKKVIIHGRSAARAQQAREAVLSRVGTDQADRLATAVGDFAELRQVSAMADAVAAEHGNELNVLLCNAGVLLPDRQLSRDGHELAFQVNHLAHFLLVQRLLPVLRANAPSRVVLVSSLCHSWHAIDWDDLQSALDYEKYEQYSRTKLMNLLFAFRLHRTLKDEQKVSVISLEPGVIQTKLLRAGGFAGAPVANGAVAPVYCASAPECGLEASGAYYSCDGKKIAADKKAHDEGDQERLWRESERLCADYLK